MRHTKWFANLLMLLTATLLAACSGDSTEMGNTDKQNEKKEMKLSANVRGLTEGSNAREAGTRATIVENASGLQAQDIKIDAYYHDTETKYLDEVKLKYSSGWKFWSGSEPGSQVHYYWPIEGSVYDPSSANITVSSLDFVGYCPYNKPSYITTDPSYNHSTGVSFTATMPTTTVETTDYMTLSNQSTLQEYLIAILDAQTYATQTAAGGGVPLNFKHPFALVKFVINAASGTHVQINHISIAGLNTTATCSYNGTTLSWGSYGGTATMKIEQVLKNGGTTETEKFVVIPNNYGTKYLTVNATWDEWSNVTISNYGTDVNFNWEPGCVYTYNLTLDQYGLTVDTHKYTEQW